VITMPARRRVDTSLITRITTGQRSIAMSVSVCLSVRDDIFATVRPIFNCFFAHGHMSTHGLWTPFLAA